MTQKDKRTQRLEKLGQASRLIREANPLDLKAEA